VWHLDMGNPHSVIAVDAVAEVPLESLGPKVAQVNLEVVEPGPELYGVTMRVHERGAGITQACGTGASAVAWAAWRWGLATLSGDEEIVVHQPGGDAYVRLTGDDRRQATLSGATVFVGTVSLAIPTG
jgi:diaminopimelate epimerase